VRQADIPTAKPAFTLIELLAVVAIIGVLGVATVASYQSIADDVRRAGAVEQVKGALARGRATAISTSQPTLVSFRPVETAPGVQQLEVVVSQFSGNTYDWLPEGLGNPGDNFNLRLARFVPVGDVKTEFLSPGIGVAATGHRFAETDDGEGQIPVKGDTEFLPTANLLGFKGIPEAPGVVPAVLFAADGSVANMMHEADSEWCFVDLNQDGLQRYRGDNYCNHQPLEGFNVPFACPEGVPDGTLEGSAPAGECWVGPYYLENSGQPAAARTLIEEVLPLCQWGEDDEPMVLISPYLAVYDDREARKQLDPAGWVITGQNTDQRNAALRGRELSDYVQANGRVLQFNRFTGVALEASER